MDRAEKKIRRLSDRDIYGYGELDKRNTVHNNRTNEGTRVSKAVALLAKADVSDIMPLCTAFLRRFGIIERPVVGERSLYFTGTTTAEAITPHEMKYAVLRLLGVNEQDAQDIFGYERRKQPAFSASFEEIFNDVTEKRSLYPLRNSDEFPELTQALKKITTPPYSIKVEEIFKRNEVPSLSILEQDGGKTKLPLAIMLSILSTALEGTPYIEYDKVLAMGDENPFKPGIISLVEKNRKEKQTPKMPLDKKSG